MEAGMRHRLTATLVLTFLLAVVSGAGAETLSPQAPGSQAAPATQQVIHHVALRDGSQLYGVMVSEDATSITLRTIAGATVMAVRDQIVAITRVQGTVVGDEFWLQDGVGSRLFLGPTGRVLRRGDSYVAIDSFFLPMFQVGVTDRFSFGVGKPFYVWTKAMWVTPKFQLYRSANTAASVGLLHTFGTIGEIGGAAYGVVTRGSTDNSVTAGVGWIYEDGTDDGSRREGTPFVLIGGERRVGRRTKVVTESYLFSGGAIVSVGGRLITRTFSFEAGVIAPVGSDGAYPGPFINFIWHRTRRPGS
jgi:hypothetical protein